MADPTDFRSLCASIIATADKRTGDGCKNYQDFLDALSKARAVLARYGAQAVAVAVAERLPGEGECDAEDRCWWWVESIKAWDLRSRRRQMVGDTHWLPHWALPLPQAEEVGS